MIRIVEIISKLCFDPQISGLRDKYPMTHVLMNMVAGVFKADPFVYKAGPDTQKSVAIYWHSNDPDALPELALPIIDAERNALCQECILLLMYKCKGMKSEVVNEGDTTPLDIPGTVSTFVFRIPRVNIPEDN